MPCNTIFGRLDRGMTRIIIEAIPPKQMRLEAYRDEGCGDWFVDHTTGDIHIQVASTRDVVDCDDDFLLALHEMIEFKLCHKHGVVQGAVDAFDKAFAGDGEPGDCIEAPYRKEHRGAMLIEHQMALLLGKWDHGSME